MQNINKKAVSDHIAIVSVVLLALIFVSVMSYVFNKITAAPELAPAVSCLEMQTSFPLAIQNSCFNSETNQIEATLKRKLGTEINSFDFSITTPSETSAWHAGPGCEGCEVLSEGQVKTYYIEQNINAGENNKIGVLINNCLIQTKEILPC
ncbi:hypothetical protein J4402_01220 [Candidatus Pacearchaeota archaeon]|nr:hypothetical protein [Candidatus Pacearchaeota archaeon]